MEEPKIKLELERMTLTNIVKAKLSTHRKEWNFLVQEKAERLKLLLEKAFSEISKEFVVSGALKERDCWTVQVVYPLDKEEQTEEIIKREARKEKVEEKKK